MQKGKIAIFGCGGLGREVAMLIEHINVRSEQWELIGFFDDRVPESKNINGYPFLGGMSELNEYDEQLAVAVAIGNPSSKKSVNARIVSPYINYPSLIHPTVLMGSRGMVSVGEGSIITAYNVLTVNIAIKRFVLLSVTCTVGHDSVLEGYVSVMPGVNISGNVHIGECAYIGAGAKIIQNISVGGHTTVGAGAVVNKNLPANCTAVGIPARAIKFH